MIHGMLPQQGASVQYAIFGCSVRNSLCAWHGLCQSTLVELASYTWSLCVKSCCRKVHLFDGTVRDDLCTRLSLVCTCWIMMYCTLGHLRSRAWSYGTQCFAARYAVALSTQLELFRMYCTRCMVHGRRCSYTELCNSS